MTSQWTWPLAIGTAIKQLPKKVATGSHRVHT